MKYNLLFLLILSLFSFGLVFAKPVTLYQDADIKTNKVAMVDSKDQLLIFFTTKDKSWVKVADPRNGNVGWVQVKELGNLNYVTLNDGAISFYSANKGNSGLQSYSSMKYTNTINNDKFNATLQKETAEAIRNMQKEQQQMEKHMQTLMQNMQMEFKNFTQKQNTNDFKGTNKNWWDHLKEKWLSKK